MKPEVVLGTGNRDKLRELQSLLCDLGVRVMPVSAFGAPPKVVEDGRTFEDNAAKKARVYSRLSDKLTIADDSGICVQALRGAPGVYSARFAGAGCTYDDNNRKMVLLLKGKKGKERAASFHSTIAVYRQGKKVAVFEGVVRGHITDEPRGRNGFGYDPLFVPLGCKKTYAEMNQAEKNLVSHRGRALRRTKVFLARYFKTLKRTK